MLQTPTHFISQYPIHPPVRYQPYPSHGGRHNHNHHVNTCSVFCSFCAKANNRRDDFAHTHRVKDREGNLTCPFLKINTCTRCYEKGHTITHCPNPSAEQELLMSRRPAPVDETEEQWAARKVQEANAELRLLKIQFMKYDFLTPKECSFCKNGKYDDDYYKTHFVVNCPRLICTQCSYCRNSGHTWRHCKLRKQNEARRNGEALPPHESDEDDASSTIGVPTSVELASSFIFDFDNDEICDTATS